MPDSSFRCFLLGADTLLMECGDILLERGHKIRGVVTGAPRVAAWARRHDLDVIDLAGDWVERLRAEPFEHLFAITHLSIIPDEVLELPLGLGINFHDGPLPRYAGLNTPVWALLAGEERYGITWHELTSGIDAGDVLAHVEFDIADDETALSLNTKCMAAALESFPGLVDALAEGRVTRTPQPSAGRTYFGRHERPAPACLIDWSGTTEEVLRFIRALSFGRYPNPLGIPKTSVEGGGPVLLVDAAEDGGPTTEDPDRGGAHDEIRPGTVLEVDALGVRIASADGSVRVTSGRDPAGAAFAGEGAAGWRAAGLAPGTRLAIAGGPLFEAAAAVSDEVARAESFWQRRLRRNDPPDIPQARHSLEAIDEPTVVSRAGAEARASVEVPLPEGVGPGAVAAAWATYLARTGRRETFAIRVPVDVPGMGAAEILCAGDVPLPVELTPGDPIGDVAVGLERELEMLRTRQPFWVDLPLRGPETGDRETAGGAGDGDVATSVGFSIGLGAPVAELLSLDVRDDGRAAYLHYAPARLDEADARTIARCIATLAAADPSTPWNSAPLLDSDAHDRVVHRWNDTLRDTPLDRCIHELFETQADRTPDRRAVAFGVTALTYRELDERANALAHRLIDAGVERGAPVGVHVGRSVDLLVATLGVLKAGAAYLPLDPDFPADRLALMVADSNTGTIVSQSGLVEGLPDTSADVLVLGPDAARSTKRPGRIASPADLAYLIYTSGSTGTPKGVMVEHRNVANFFVGMDDVVDHDPPGVWLAVTSLSFDISVLELFWTLARGFTVVIYDDPRPETGDGDTAVGTPAACRPIDFGLFMWGNDDGPGPAKYRLMMEGARYFDEHGFHSVWTPERHFHAFGGPFPNPSVTGAAIAAVTERVAIRSGSCVSPLHHPVRIAEEWSVVDNLSDGRVGLAFASGWQPNDFVLQPGNYGRQKDVMFEHIELVRRLWRGETVEFESPAGGTAEIRTLPRPVQAELPFWVTTAGNPETYAQAGRLGANVLTHLLGQSLDEVAEKIRIYREARAEAGFDPDAGRVTLMLHTFVGEDDDSVRELVRQPMKDYLGASMKLALGFAWTFPAFRRPGHPGADPEDIDLGSLSKDETDAILEFAFERYYETSGLFGTPERCIDMVERCKAIGADEIACLLDFGVDTDAVLEALPLLKRVKDATARPASPEPASTPRKPASTTPATFAEQIEANGVTHLQCTPSMARLILADADARPGLARLDHLLVGGESLPVPLAADLAEDVGGGRITNMYGPTETTIWSSTHEVVPGEDPMPIGRPIVNTRLYVLDSHMNPLPPGVPGELWIGGDGVTRGYHDRPDLTAERFVPDPFVETRRDAVGTVRPRMYRTGDLVRFRRDGVLDFLGRVDRQVKFRGYRIELGEIEAVLDAVDGISSAAVLLREDHADAALLVAYVVGEDAATDEARLRTRLRERLPGYMVPSRIVRLERMPLTPNGKVDRRALPAPGAERTVGPVESERVEPESDLEHKVAECWRQVLQVDRVGVEDNFFDIGGHSLLVVQLHRLLTDRITGEISLVDLYRFPTIRRLVHHLDASGGDEAALDESIQRAERRREALQRRRGRG